MMRVIVQALLVVLGRVKKLCCFKKIVAILTIAIYSCSFAGGMTDSLNNYFNSVGMDGNATSATAYQGQAMGYLSGGSVYSRAGSMTVQIAHITAPDVTAGCGGINMYLGGFSYITMPEVIQFAKQVLANGVGYAFHLAMEVGLPQIHHVLTQIQEWIQKINSMMANSCELAQNLVGGAAGALGVANNTVCKDIGANSGVFSDWAKSQSQCSTQSGYNEAMDRAKADNGKTTPKPKVDINLVYDALQNSSTLRGNKELAEWFMSIYGTTIYDNTGNASSYAPTLDSKGIEAILDGGTVSVYKCKNDKCTSMDKETINYSQRRWLC